MDLEGVEFFEAATAAAAAIAAAASNTHNQSSGVDSYQKFILVAMTSTRNTICPEK
jgi:hypothetical protein